VISLFELYVNEAALLWLRWQGRSVFISGAGKARTQKADSKKAAEAAFFDYWLLFTAQLSVLA
jgi:hypothetical protein